MSVQNYINALRQEIANHRAKNSQLVCGGTLDEKGYGYSCGYIKCLDDMLKLKSEDGEPGFIEHVYDQMQRS